MTSALMFSLANFLAAARASETIEPQAIKVISCPFLRTWACPILKGLFSLVNTAVFCLLNLRYTGPLYAIAAASAFLVS